MSIPRIISWIMDRTDQVFKWHGGKVKRDHEEKISIAVDKRDASYIKSVVRDIEKLRKKRRNSS